MRSAVIIKGNKYGFQIVLQPDLPFERLLSEVETRFRASGDFFDRRRPMAISFAGRELSEEEQDRLVDTIQASSRLVVSYVIDGAKAYETGYAKALSAAGKRAERAEAAEPSGSYETGRSFDAVNYPEESVDGGEEPGEEIPDAGSEYQDPVSASAGKEREIDSPVFPEDEVGKHGQFYRGILRSGQKIEVDGSFMILGDVNPGAQIIAGGNVVVLGSLKGTVYAGYPKDRNAIVAALVMEPMQIQIGDFIARSADVERKRGKRPLRKRKQPDLEARMAYVDEGNICIDKIDRQLITKISGRN